MHNRHSVFVEWMNTCSLINHWYWWKQSLLTQRLNRQEWLSYLLIKWLHDESFLLHWIFSLFQKLLLILNLSQKDNNSHSIVTKIKTISQYINSSSNTGVWDWFKTVVPILFGTRDRFPGRQCFHRPGRWNGGFRMIQARYTHCAFTSIIIITSAPPLVIRH